MHTCRGGINLCRLKVLHKEIATIVFDVRSEKYGELFRTIARLEIFIVAYNNGAYLKMICMTV